MTKVIKQDNGETIELTEVDGYLREDTPRFITSKVMAEIYSAEGWLLWYVGLFNSEHDAIEAALATTRR